MRQNIYNRFYRKTNYDDKLVQQVSSPLPRSPLSGWRTSVMITTSRKTDTRFWASQVYKYYRCWPPWRRSRCWAFRSLASRCSPATRPGPSGGLPCCCVAMIPVDLTRKVHWRSTVLAGSTSKSRLALFLLLAVLRHKVRGVQVLRLGGLLPLLLSQGCCSLFWALLLLCQNEGSGKRSRWRGWKRQGSDGWIIVNYFISCAWLVVKIEDW